MFEKTSKDAEILFQRGLKEMMDGNTPSALSFFERALDIEKPPVYVSYYAYCVAKERGQINKAILLCRDAIEKDPENPVHYLNLGKVYLLAGKKSEGVKVFREGLKCGLDERILSELDRLGTRRPPVIPFLHRNNPMNKYLGIFFKKIGLR